MSVPRTVTLRQARAQLSRLVAQAARGQAFVITRAGKPLVRVLPLPAQAAQRDLGGLARQMPQSRLPADIKAGGLPSSLSAVSASTSPDQS